MSASDHPHPLQTECSRLNRFSADHSEQFGKTSGRFPMRLLMALALLVTLVLAFAACGAVAGHSPSAHGTPTQPGWQTYRDPTGSFTIQVPAGWTATFSEGTGSEGNSATGLGASYPAYTVRLGDPPGSPSGITVAVNYHPLVNDYLRQKACRAQTNATLAGLPAQQDDNTSTVWSNATEYQFGFSIGDRRGTLQTEQTVPTPLPQSVVQANQQLYDEIIATFHPIPATRLSCSGS